MVFFWGAAKQWITNCFGLLCMCTDVFWSMGKKKELLQAAYEILLLEKCVQGSELIKVFLWSGLGLTLGHVMSKTKPKWCCKYSCVQVLCKMCLELGFGVTYLCLPLSLLPVPQAHICLLVQLSPKCLCCFPAPALEVNFWVFVQALITTQSEDASGSFSSVKAHNNIPHLWVTSLDDFGCFHRNMADECCPGKHYFGVIWSIHFCTTKTAFDSHKLLGEAFVCNSPCHAGASCLHGVHLITVDSYQLHHERAPIPCLTWLEVQEKMKAP